MTKEQYLEDLYKELQKYDADSTLKHVTEYDYIISDMLEDSSIDEVIEKLGSSQSLAQNLAEEFGYELKNNKQFEEPIINRKKTYNTRSSRDILALVINIFFIIFSVIFFISFITTSIVLLISLLIAGSFGISMIFWLLAFVFMCIFTLSIYMIGLNLKNLLINKISRNTSGVN